MPDATYVGAGMPCGNCGNPLTPGQPHKCGRVENPYAPSSDWKPGQDTFTAQAAGIWDEGFAAGRAAFDAVVAERDKEAADSVIWHRIAREEGQRLEAARAERDAANDLIERAWSLISEVMALAKCSQTQEWLVYAKAWQHDYEGSSE